MKYLLFALFALIAALAVPRVLLSQSPPAPAFRSAADYPSIQAAIDAGPGVVRIPAGTWTYYAPIVLPRTDLGGKGGVTLVGDGAGSTYLVPGYNIPWTDGDGVITWAPAGTNRRAWNQSISGITINLPTGHAAAGIRYKISNTSDPTGLEKSQGRLTDITINAYNDWAQKGVVVEGVAHNWVIHRLVVDAGARYAETYDVIGLEVSTGSGDNGLDNGGAYSWSVEDYSTAVRTPGGVAMVRGRFFYANFRDLVSGRGTLGTPIIDMVNSAGVTIEGLTTEGREEDPAVRLKDSRNMTLRDFGIGSPDGAQVGVLMDNVSSSRVIDWVVFPGKVEWDDLGATRVRLIGPSKGNYVAILIGDDGYQGDGGENPEVVIKNLAPDPSNWVTATNVTTGVTVVVEYKP